MEQCFIFKDFYWLVLMAIINAGCLFIWASIGAPGNTSDSTLLQSTDIWKRILGGQMILNVCRLMEDIEILPIILGDRAFPLRTLL